jgi:hypothetical protein
MFVKVEDSIYYNSRTGQFAEVQYCPDDRHYIILIEDSPMPLLNHFSTREKAVNRLKKFVEDVNDAYHD